MLNLLRRFSGAYRRYFIIGPLAKLVEACFDLITPLVVASMIDNGVGARDMGSVVRHGLVLVAMAVVGIGHPGLPKGGRADVAGYGYGHAPRALCAYQPAVLCGS